MCKDMGFECTYTKASARASRNSSGEELVGGGSGGGAGAGGLAGFRALSSNGRVDFYGNGQGFDELHRMQMWEQYSNSFQLASTKGVFTIKKKLVRF